MALTNAQVDELEKRATEQNDCDAIKALAAAAREHAQDQVMFRFTSRDGAVKIVNATQYMALTATDLSGGKLEQL